MLQHAAWTEVPGLRHGFLDRRDSAGAGEWSPIVAALGVALPVHTAKQVHGIDVVTAPIAGERPDADAVATNDRGLVVGVVTADCVPVLLVAREQRVAAAVHAGWRGASAGVIESAIGHMRSAFDVEPGDLEACIGPAIGPCCYRVGEEVRTAFVARTGDTTAPAWHAGGGELRVDLRLAARLLLEGTGVRRVDVVGPCTSCGDGWCSYRRDGARAGRQLSFIGWT